jgi:hypothetical protein
MDVYTKLLALTIGLAIALLAATGQVSGQTVVNGTPAYVPAPHHVHYGYPYYRPHASTAAEGYLNGVSNVIYAQGQYNYYTSMAAINAQEARRLSIENHQAGVKAYFETRKMNREYRAAERHPAANADSKAKIAQTERPRPLSPQELDAATGKIRWPKLLAADTHADNREALDNYFAVRAEKRAVSTREMTELRNVALAMMADLKEQRRSATPDDYEAAAEFLRSLACEGQRPVGEGPRLVASAK